MTFEMSLEVSGYSSPLFFSLAEIRRKDVICQSLTAVKTNLLFCYFTTAADILWPEYFLMVICEIVLFQMGE